MAYYYHQLPESLGIVTFDNKDYKVIRIDHYPDKSQVIHLLNENGEKLEMKYKPIELEDIVR